MLIHKTFILIRRHAGVKLRKKCAANFKATHIKPAYPL